MHLLNFISAGIHLHLFLSLQVFWQLLTMFSPGSVTNLVSRRDSHNLCSRILKTWPLQIVWVTFSVLGWLSAASTSLAHVSQWLGVLARILTLKNSVSPIWLLAVFFAPYCFTIQLVIPTSPLAPILGETSSFEALGRAIIGLTLQAQKETAFCDDLEGYPEIMAKLFFEFTDPRVPLIRQSSFPPNISTSFCGTGLS